MGIAVETWAVQLITLLGVAIGLVGSFVSTHILDRGRWHREEVRRWEDKRLECYTEYAAALMRFITLGYRISAGLGLPAHVQGLDAEPGLPALALAEEEVSIQWESMLMLGSQEVIEAARRWRHQAWLLESFARGLRTNPDEFHAATKSRRTARQQFYFAARADLGVVTGAAIMTEPALTGDDDLATRTPSSS